VISADKNAVAQQLLEGLGFNMEPEPSWLGEGEKPDFFCTGPADLWAEVKTIKESDRFQALARRADWLRDREKTIAESGKAFAWVDEEATEQHIKAAIALARDAMRELTAIPSNPGRVCAVVPHDADFSSRVRITLETKEGTELILAVRSRSGHYGRPQSAEHLTGRGGVTIEDTGGNRRTADPFELGMAEDDFAVGCEVERSAQHFRFPGIMLTGPARKLTTVEKVRNAAKKANSQFKSARRCRIAPCLLMVFQDGIFVQEPWAFASAFYGDRVIEFGTGRRLFGLNGLWSATANRTTSAASLIRNNGAPMLIPNPWATVPIPAGVLPWAAGQIGTDGSVNLPE
jgi:hypothetical protein